MSHWMSTSREIIELAIEKKEGNYDINKKKVDFLIFVKIFDSLRLIFKLWTNKGRGCPSHWKSTGIYQCRDTSVESLGHELEHWFSQLPDHKYYHTNFP